VNEEEKNSFTVIDWSADLIGSLSGVSLAILHNDVAGLLAGAAVGPSLAHAFRYGANLFVNRVLAGREKARVGFVYGVAAHKISERLDNGEQPRADDFFKSDVTGRSSAEEIAEAVLIAAQREHEERKLPYIANVLAFVAFTPGIDRATANQMVRIASSLSYRQFCVLALANAPNRVNMYSEPYYGSTGQAASLLLALLNEIFELYQEHLIGFEGTMGIMSRAPTDPRSMPVQNLLLGGLGDLLYQAMRLSDMPPSECEDIVRTLTRR
jgi:hypothetical protein